MPSESASPCILFDWGDTLMRVFPEYPGPMATWPGVAAMPHAVEALRSLHSSYRLAIATNAADSGEAQIRAALQRASLDEWIERVYCFRTIGARKPSPEFFAFILEDLQLDRRQVFMVGDDFEADVRGANASGLRAVWYNPFSELNRSDELYRTVHDLADLPHILQTFP